ncbi:hypothetical protein BEL07_22855 [Mycolicibacterium grossiae]|uniref:Uncharacterized protein n=2 Tax=Mycolicibacterium grossiae TaxID=1552759 RepID=A0A1E8Q061_9MYCO|nr:hypothetical protein BEL07_22855 [Mycolicibacterium grossiae]
MSRYAEFEALGASGSAYERWTEANTRLGEAMGVAAAQKAAPPVAAMDADFQAGLAVARAVIAFANACPPAGPHLDDLRNAAFVQAMVQAVTPQLAQEIEALAREWAAWLPAVGRWTPASGERPPPRPPPRPASPAHSHVLATVDAWWEAEQESMRERVLEMFTKAAAEVTGTSIDVGPDGQVIESTHVEFRSPPEQLASPRGVAGRLRRRFSRDRRHK